MKLRTLGARASCPHIILYLMGFCLILGACQAQVSGNDITFDGPSGLAVAGTEERYLFVTNSQQDALQVLMLGDDLTEIDLVKSPGGFFPLRIPTGSDPIALASTDDGAYVLVLERVSASVRLVDADQKKLVRDATGESVELRLGGSLARPSAMISAPGQCDASTCAGAFWVTLEGLGQVTLLRVLKPVAAPAGDGLPKLRIVATYDVGGAPGDMAASPDGKSLYIADRRYEELIILDTPSHGVERVELQAFGGPVALSGDGSFVFVGRSLLRDVLVFQRDNATGSLTRLDGNSRVLPSPACLAQCGSTPPCSDQHLADVSVCLDGPNMGIVPNTPLYDGVFVGMLPMQMLWVQGSAAPLKIPCVPDPDNAASVSVTSDYASYLLVVGASGSMRYIRVDTDTAEPKPSVISSEWCQTGSVRTAVSSDFARPSVNFSEEPLKSWLGLCPEVPTIDGVSRNGYQQICFDDAGTSRGMVAMSGQPTGAFTLEWEGLLLSRNIGGGSITESGLADRALDPRVFGVAIGDRVQILTPPLIDGACASLAQCSFERVITQIDSDGNTGVVMTLDAPFNGSCFPGGGRDVRYQIRAGSSFVVTNPLGPTSRLALGESYGPGRLHGRTDRLMFSIRSDLTNTPQLDACARYLVDGRAQGSQSPVLSRDRLFGFVVRDAFTPWTHGTGFDSNGAQGAAVGQLPGDLVMTPASNGAILRAFISYTGSNAVLAFEPSTIDERFAAEHYRIFQ